MRWNMVNLKKIKQLVEEARQRSPLSEKVGAVLIHLKTGKYVLGFNHEKNGKLYHAEHDALIKSFDHFSLDEAQELHLFTDRRPCRACTNLTIVHKIKGAYYSLPQPEMGHLQEYADRGILCCSYIDRPYTVERILREGRRNAFSFM